MSKSIKYGQRILCLMLLAGTNLMARADTVTFSGTGMGQGETLSATATLELVHYNYGTGTGAETTNLSDPLVLKITVTNNAPTTTHPADLLTGVFLTANPDVVWGTTGTTFDGKAQLVTYNGAVTTTATNVDIAPAVNGTSTDGGWVLTNGNSSGGFGTYGAINLTAYNVGLTTVGAGYPSVRGNDVGPPADNYGIYSENTTPPLSTSLSQQVPLIQGTATFYLMPISIPGGTPLSLNMVTGMAFVYGSAPSYKVVGSHHPVPSGLVLALTGIGPLAFAFSRRWRSVLNHPS